MRILAISDSHRRSGVVARIIRQQPTAKHVFFLGDTTGDIEDLIPEFPDKSFHIVCGNCDFFSTYPSSGFDIIDGVKIFYTHGHTLGVKYGVDNLRKTAVDNGTKIALYGHTHVSQILYENGLYIVNPGSCSEPRNGNASYAVIDIMESGILPSIVEV